MSPGQLAIAARGFVTQLERHLRNEEDLLASGRAPQDVPGTAALGGHPHEWYPLTEGPVVDLDALPEDEAVAAAVDRLLRMRRGEQVELRSGAEPGPGMAGDQRLGPGGYQFTVLQDGPARWRMQVTRRRGQLTRKAAARVRAPARRAARANRRSATPNRRHQWQSRYERRRPRGKARWPAAPG